MLIELSIHSAPVIRALWTQAAEKGAGSQDSSAFFWFSADLGKSFLL